VCGWGYITDTHDSAQKNGFATAPARLVFFTPPIVHLTINGFIHFIYQLIRFGSDGLSLLD